ncbi:putative meiotically up-regulated protein [Clavispora lusitaniae]|uniref:Meiotically up-regulated protein n=1 Tax=Clavispora lusitaniae TaxID=36911 RepID=A0ACD0WMZ7_CLALS|nr:putative meiotically up-regulated protein [Clavispora lusitaniae]QFZ34418.1 putative meiotically up-regulated protein [Clavispora lusitaniae]QFZ40102.1 putative meiotically up-regulated protein [Clavispora lusitaniae]QFZ45784.1 putative meiotically up-regulated protein [Clavispora lusitaniae]QFZ51448.1 putative meiotically up-regulated protein [Clavispora lusitaniae]
MSPSLSEESQTSKKYDFGTRGAHNIAKGGEHPHLVPSFDDPLAERKWVLEHAAGAFRVFARMGYCEGEAGHISVRDPVDPQTFFINPLGVHFAMIMPSDLVHVGADGSILPDGNQVPINAAGYSIHSALLKARPDINAACHTHSIHGRSFSTFGRPLEMLNQDACIFYNNQAVYTNFGGVAIEGEEGLEIAEAAKGTRNVILQNHGLLTMGKTVDEAAYMFTLMENSCHAQLMADAAAASGIEKKYISDDVAAYSAFVTNDSETMYGSFQPEFNYQVRLDKREFLAT